MMSDSSLVKFAIETPNQPDVSAMLSASDQYMAGLYPAESNHLVNADDLLASNARFVVGRQSGLCVACGAVLFGADGPAEIKRMWVEPHARGLKLGRRLLTILERVARDEGVKILRLETGISQVEAINLYESTGFSRIDAFGAYKPDPLSIFMEKRFDREHD